MLLWWVSVDPAIDVPTLHFLPGLIELVLTGGGLFNPSLVATVLPELRIVDRRGGGSELCDVDGKGDSGLLSVDPSLRGLREKSVTPVEVMALSLKEVGSGGSGFDESRLSTILSAVVS
jgi:hypothetical protein